MKPLAGQKILLIGIGFYDYEAAIANEFQSLGAEVRIEDERPAEMRGRFAGLRRRLSLDIRAALARHHAEILERARISGTLDHIVVIKGTLLDQDFLVTLRRAQPTAQFIAYHWDSMARYPELIDRQSLFDRVLTFDHADASAHPNFEFRPLFFRQELASLPATAQTSGICFVGWLHHQRLMQVKAIRSQADALGLDGFYYLLTGKWTQAKLCLSGNCRDVRSRPLPFSLYSEAMAVCDVVLDLPHPEQTGMTMRAIEAVGAGKKLITTARDVVKYDFYRPENICIIDADAPRISQDFLSSPKVTLSSKQLSRYDLRTWALDVCGATAPNSFLNRTEELNDRP